MRADPNGYSNPAAFDTPIPWNYRGRPYSLPLRHGLRPYRPHNLSAGDPIRLSLPEHAHASYLHFGLNAVGAIGYRRLVAGLQGRRLHANLRWQDARRLGW